MADIGRLVPRGAAADKQQWAAWAGYDGTRFHGVAPQPGRSTVLGLLRGRLAALGLAPVWAVSAASRTDAGVHAVANLVTWRQPAAADAAAQAAALAGAPADGLRLHGAAPLRRRVLARAMAAAKHYRYLLAEPGGAPRPDAWQRAAPLDVAAMAAAARCLPGRHDFAALRSRGCDQACSVRTLQAVAVRRVAAHLVQVDVHGDAFLRRMVRLIVGALVATSAGERPPAALVAQLAGERPAGGPPPPAPAHGLTLVAVVVAPAWRSLLGPPPAGYSAPNAAR